MDDDLGEALGQAYVDKYFGPQSKQQALKMVNEIEAAMQQDINRPAVDVPGDKAAGDREASCDGQQDRLSRQVARL